MPKRTLLAAYAWSGLQHSQIGEGSQSLGHNVADDAGCAEHLMHSPQTTMALWGTAGLLQILVLQAASSPMQAC